MQPLGQTDELNKKDKPKWSKLNKVENINDDGDNEIDSDDEIVKIEVEDDGIVVIDEREKLRLEEKKNKEYLESEEQRKKEKQTERLRKEEKERQRKEEEERLRKQEEERRKKEEEARLRREEEEYRKNEEAERLRRKKEEQHKKEEERLRREENERRRKEEEERLRKEEDERRKKEEENRLRREEEERKRREEEERLQEEEECRLKEEENERKKQEEERLRREREEQKQKEKQEADRKRKELEELEIEKKRKEEENKKKVARLKKEAEVQKLKEIEEKKKRSKPINDDDDAENGDAMDVPSKSKKIIEKMKAIDRTEAKPKLKNDNQSTSKTITKKPSSDNSKSKAKKDADTVSLRLAELNDIILSVPTFVPNFTAVQDPACQQHGKIFLRQLRGYKLWALQMLDSSAKIPSGLLRGNVNQLGDFDQCLEVLARVKIDEKTVKIQGKYCLASMDIYALHQAAKLPVNLMQGRALIRGNMRDPGHFVPKFTTINWALCLPAVCTAQDARKSIENALGSYNMTIGMKFMVDVDPDMCYVKPKVQSYTKETIGVLYFFVFFICLAIAATFRDYFITLQDKGSYSERIIMSFSLKRTVKALFANNEASSSDIGCIHGIRSLATIVLYAAHKLIPMSRMPYANRISLTEIANHPLSTILRTSLVYTDSFLLLSGVLTAYNMAKELESRGEIRWFCRLIARYVRLTPCLIVVVFWYAYVMEYIGSGPQWNAVVKSNADICKENSWINLLYVQNYFPFEEMCATHTHQLALDMQLFLVAPALVFFLLIKPIVGIIIVFFLLQISATLRYLATSNNNLSLVIFHGMTLKHLYKTANLTYTLPLHRATPYLFGVSLGVLLHCTGRNLRLHKIFALFGWLMALALGSWSLFSPWRLAKRDYTYDVEQATYYAVISPILTALALCWAIFACFTNSGGIINRILSNHWMVVFSRLSYAIYLTQFAVFFYNVGTVRYASDFQSFRTIDLHEAIIVISVSVVLTLLFDIPMQEVKNIIMECSDTLAEIEADKSTENHLHQQICNIGHKTSKDTTLDDDEECAPGGWNWNRGVFTKSVRPEPREYEENGIEEYRSSRIKRQDIRRQSMIRSEDYEEWDGRNISRRTSRFEDDGRTSRSDYRLSDAGLEDLPSESYIHPRERYYSRGYSRSPMKDLDTPLSRRSVSRERPLPKEEDISREYNRRPLITISKEEDYQSPRSPRSFMSRFNDNQRSLSSESEDPISNRRSSGNYSRRLSAEPRVADEDDWGENLPIHRNRFIDKRVSSQERERMPSSVEEEDNNQWSSLKRRSSAEGKMALLKEPFRPGNMELWTVSKMALGSSQEPDEEDEEVYLQQRREYREQEPPLREEFEGEDDDSSRRRSFASESLPTSFDEEEDSNSNEFSLSKGTRNLHVTVQDLSKLSAEDDTTMNDKWNKLDIKSGLFKRESIVKSQASEEDPEYLLPERPKLIEQEQEHPFKKAWQMQKSRSEEEGSAAFIIKEQTKVSSSLEKQKEESEEKSENENLNKTGEQEIDIPEPDVKCEVTLVWQPRNTDFEDTKSSTKSTSSTSSAHITWPDEEEQFENYRNRRKSDEENWMWSEKHT
ncbi:uncharacterized protein LOC131671260 isoform X2 [Phymastichus coffea]|nr:uncharacterized protein LOC131671260 isoform X2 [Phymastichus coffea]